jgi:phenylpropionate dioxygenase-like ring-hydroxylating dioxygenase large terminal subunit
MDQTTQIDLVRRALAHLENRTTDRAGGPTLRPVAAYADPARLGRETAALFRDMPVAIAHASTLPAPGDFLTHDASGVPLLVVRGDDGKLRAFLNVCRHRGTRLENAPCGQKKAFVCPYHAWSYTRSGSLLAIPHDSGFAGIDREGRGLVPVAVAETSGFVWVRPRPAANSADAELDIATFLGPQITRDLAGFGVDGAHVYAPRTFTKDVGWKLAIDVFLEAYHLKTAHRTTIYPIFFDNLGLVDPLGPHLRNVFPKRTLRDLPSLPPERWELRKHANILFHLFPNTLILVEPDHCAILHVWPDGPSRTILTTYTLVPEAPVAEKARAYWDLNNEILYRAIGEDLALGESIQRGFASGANDEVVFGAFEHALEHFHREVDRRTLADATR